MGKLDFNLEALYYSEAQAELIKKQGDDIGVIMVNGTPTLWTETKISFGLSFGQGDASLSSNWKDAVRIPGSLASCPILVNGRGELTQEGKAYCAKKQIGSTPQALRSIALKPGQ